jgi:hypothetical protein
VIAKSRKSLERTNTVNYFDALSLAQGIKFDV